MYELEAPPQSSLDIEAQLLAVQAALHDATIRRTSIEAEIRSTTSIEVLATLHDQWSDACADQQSAQQRLAELEELLK